MSVPWAPACVPSNMTETERNLLDTLSRFPSAVAKTGRSLRPSQLTEYAFTLATSFTDFYEHPDPGAEVQTPFIHLEDEGLRTFRLALVQTFQKVMAKALSLLGMPTLERI